MQCSTSLTYTFLAFNNSESCPSLIRWHEYQDSCKSPDDGSVIKSSSSFHPQESALDPRWVFISHEASHSGLQFPLPHVYTTLPLGIFFLETELVEACWSWETLAVCHLLTLHHLLRALALALLASSCSQHTCTKLLLLSLGSFCNLRLVLRSSLVMLQVRSTFLAPLALFPSAAFENPRMWDLESFPSLSSQDHWWIHCQTLILEILLL